MDSIGKIDSKDTSNYNVYRMEMVDGKEYFIFIKLEQNTRDLLDYLSPKKGTFFSLQQLNVSRERHPVYFSKTTIASVEKVAINMVSINSSKVWGVSNG